MSIANIVIAIAIVALLVFRQLQVRPVKEDRPYLIVLILGVIGLIEIEQYINGKNIPVNAYLILGTGLVLAAVFGYLRALATRVWRKDDGVAFRQGNAITVVLWIIGIALHIGSDLILRNTAPEFDTLGSVSLLLYLAITLAVQRWVVLGKAARLSVS